MNRDLVKHAGVLILILAICVPVFVFAQQSEPLVPCGRTASDPCTFADIFELMDRIIDFLLITIALPIAGLLFAWAGFLYLTAAGDEGQVKKAHGVFQNVFIGLILALAAWLIVNLIVSILTGGGINVFLNKQS